MFGFPKRPTSKFDVIMAIAGAVVGVWKAVDVVKDFQHEQETKENEQ